MSEKVEATGIVVTYMDGGAGEFYTFSPVAAVRLSIHEALAGPERFIHLHDDIEDRDVWLNSDHVAAVEVFAEVIVDATHTAAPEPPKRRKKKPRPKPVGSADDSPDGSSRSDP